MGYHDLCHSVLNLYITCVNLSEASHKSTTRKPRTLNNINQEFTLEQLSRDHHSGNATAETLAILLQMSVASERTTCGHARTTRQPAGVYDNLEAMCASGSGRCVVRVVHEYLQHGDTSRRSDQVCGEFKSSYHESARTLP